MTTHAELRSLEAVRAKADRAAIEDRAIEVAKVAAPIYAARLVHVLQSGEPPAWDKLMGIALMEAGDLIDEAVRQLEERAKDG